jgi:hypothetical protein
MKRFNDSCERLSLPSLDQQGFLECIKKLVTVCLCICALVFVHVCMQVRTYDQQGLLACIKELVTVCLCMCWFACVGFNARTMRKACIKELLPV